MTKLKKKLGVFFACLIIILGFAGFVFYLGWVQIKVPVDSIGIMASKTGGISDELITNGKFSWKWESVIPSNAELRLYKTGVRSFSRNISGVLSSSELYSGLYRTQPDFSYNFDFTFEVFISDENILKLNQDGTVKNQKELDSYIENVIDAYLRTAIQKIVDVSSSKVPFLPETVDFNSLLKEADRPETHPEIEFRTINVKNIRCPDMMLYLKARDIYLKSVDTSARVFDEILSENSKSDGKSGNSRAITEKINQLSIMLEDLKKQVQ